MKFIRSTGHLAPGIEPVTSITALEETGMTTDEYRAHMLRSVPTAYIVVDEFEHDGPLEAAVGQGVARHNNAIEEEREAAALFHWNAGLLPNAGWMIYTPAPTRLNVELVSDVLVQLARHPNYASQMVRCYAVDENGKLTEVTMKDGKVTTIERGTIG